MTRRWIPAVVLTALIAVLFSFSPAPASEWKTIEDSDWCSPGKWYNDDAYCEIREITLDADRNVVRVDAGANGGITVEGWDRDEIRLQARIRAWSRRDDDAKEIADRITIDTKGTIKADGPDQRRKHGWSVSYRLMVPKKMDLDLVAHNGGLSVSDIEGEILLETTNGGLALSNLAGSVDGTTVNGGVRLELSGKTWNGDGIDVETTNGGIDLDVPEGYSARLETGTVNGRIEVDFPITVQGRINKSIKATLGDGGPKVRVKTTNGGVRISRG